MYARVTAILIARNGAQWLPRTLEALAAQSRTPDALILVDLGSTDGSGALLSEASPTHMIETQSRHSFGTAVSHALGVLPPATDEDEWLWLLAHDTAPDPGALAALMAAVEVNPSVGVAGPKQMDWDDPDFIIEFGETLTSTGASFQLAERELDQAQHDTMSDVLAVGAAGMLVRRTLWERLHGFDPALPTADNGLDFCVRTRLSGSRVMAVPSARVATGGSGLSGPGRSTKGSARRRRRTARRAAQLHRRLVYTSGFALVFHWLSLVPIAILRSLFQLVRKQPGAIGGELAAAFMTALGGRVGEARRTLRSASTASWKSLAGLRVPGSEVRRRRALQREFAISASRGDHVPVQFVATGGLTTLLLATVAGLVVFLPFLGAGSLTGGSLLPLSATPGDLWSHVGYGWRDVGLGLVGGADPFAYVLAILGSITFWSPSLAIVGVYLAAFPLAALAAWFLAAHFTTRGWLRGVAAALWVLAPPFLAALAGGELGGILAHLLLPWLVLAGVTARRSWSASAIAALLFAGVTACAPSLWPVLLLVWIVATATAGRNVMRLIGIPIPALVLVLPLAVSQFRAGNPIGLLADPGAPSAHDAPGFWDLLVGLPTSGSPGWTSVESLTGLAGAVLSLALAVLVVPLVLLALSSLFLAPIRRAATAALLGVGGFATAAVASHVSLQTASGESIPLWAGAGLSLYWLGMVGASVLALAALPRLASLASLITALAALVLVLPLLAAPLVGTALARATSGAQLPAYVTAEASSTPRVGTLQISVDASGGVIGVVQHGRGPTLDNQSTLASTGTQLTQAEQDFARLVGQLSSRSGATAVPQLAQLGVEFIVVSPAAADQQTATAMVAHIQNSLNSNSSLTPVGATAFGQLWQVSTPGLATLPAPDPTNTGSLTGVVVLIVQILVFGVALLLALPAGRLEVRPTEGRTPRSARAAARNGSGPDPDVVAAPEADVVGEPALDEPSFSEVELDAYAQPDSDEYSLREPTGQDERV